MKRDMKLMLVLKYLENSFDKQSLKIKIELVLFPLAIFFILIIAINGTIDYEQKTSVETKTSDTFNNIIMKNRIVDILNDLEEFIKINKMSLNKISNNKQSIKIEIKANTSKQLLFIKFVEDYNSFSKIKYLKKEEDSLFIEINFDKLYIKNSFDLKSDLISFENNTNTNVNVNFKLFAIVDNSVLINNKWLKKEDSIDSFKIKDIKENSIFLSNGLKTIKLKIDKNENN